MSAPSASANFEHLLRLSDDTGLFEHAKGAVPRREHGYCVDDVARGLVLLAREPGASPAQSRLQDVYLTFLAHAQSPEGAFHNRLGYDRRWQDQPSTGDWWGRALWALGTVVAGAGPAWRSQEALERFSLGCRRRSPWLRSMVFAALGAYEVLTVLPGHPGARALLADTVAAIGPPRLDPGWPWPEARLAYANAQIPEALIAAGSALGDAGALAHGKQLLLWLVARQTIDGHLSPVPAQGAGPSDAGPRFDQQPIEVASVADAAVRALAVTGEDRWRGVLDLALGWFLGDNDRSSAMQDPRTGGGYDGLMETGPNLNQGAESTIAWLLTRQHAALARHHSPLALAPC